MAATQSPIDCFSADHFEMGIRLLMNAHQAQNSTYYQQPPNVHLLGDPQAGGGGGGGTATATTAVAAAAAAAAASTDTTSSKKEWRQTTSPVATSETGGGKDGEQKRARGRPRVHAKDVTAADRRRTQIRLAQRAYRSRREHAIMLLEQKVRALEEANEAMSSAFMSLHDAAISHGLVDRHPDFAQQLRTTTEVFLDHAKRSSCDEDGTTDNEAACADVTDTKRHIFPDGMPCEQYTLPMQPLSTATTAATPTPGIPAAKQPQRQRQRQRQRQQQQQQRQTQQQQQPQICCDALLTPPEAVEGTIYSDSAAAAALAGNINDVDARNLAAAVAAVAAETMPNLNTTTAATTTSAAVTTAGYCAVDTTGAGGYYTGHTQQQQQALTSAAHAGYGYGVVSDTLVTDTPGSGLAPPPSYAWLEKSFGLRLRRVALERANDILSFPNLHPNVYASAFRYCFGLGPFQNIVDHVRLGNCFIDSSLEFPCGFMPVRRRGNRLYFVPGRGSKAAIKQEGIDAESEPELWTCAETPTAENSFYDWEGTEVYLRRRGVVIPPGAERVIVEVDVADFGHGPSDYDSGDTSDSGSMSDGSMELVNGNVGREEAMLTSYMYGGHNMAASQSQVSGIPSMGKLARSGMAKTHRPIHRTYTLDVTRFTDELAIRGTCIIRSPGFRPCDMNEAFWRSVQRIS